MRKIANVFVTFIFLFYITACEKNSATTTNYSYIKYETIYFNSPAGILVSNYVNNSDDVTHSTKTNPLVNMEFTTGPVKKGFEANMKTVVESLFGVSEFNITQNIYGSTDGNTYKLIKSKSTNLKTLPKDSAQISYTVE